MKRYKHRVNRQEFLNCPGFHDGAYVRAYVEDTTDRGMQAYAHNDEPYNISPRILLQIADCNQSISLEFDLNSGNQRENSFHKIDTLISALQEFREGLVAESTEYKRRERALREWREAKNADKAGNGSAHGNTAAGRLLARRAQTDINTKNTQDKKRQAMEEFFAERGVDLLSLSDEDLT